jgi:hypothetical protein
MRRDESLREYTNRYFENRNTLAGVKDDDVIAYTKRELLISSCSRRSTKPMLKLLVTSWPTSTNWLTLKTR